MLTRGGWPRGDVVKNLKNVVAVLFTNLTARPFSADTDLFLYKLLPTN